MAFRSSRPDDIDVYIGIGTRKTSRNQNHCALILAPQTTSGNSTTTNNCTYYHVTNGPNAYKHYMERNAPLLDSTRLQYLQKIGVIPCLRGRRWLSPSRGAGLVEDAHGRVRGFLDKAPHSPLVQVVEKGVAGRAEAGRLYVQAAKGARKGGLDAFEDSL
ncbi:hypothetical protein BDW74DRAFT_179143 [Aspergillus multicolor]|uniref:uncharacterized protein n=1 Tax=Aspergillus multicolor TaxID=41759 RepID=UPI003CCD8BC6